MHSLPLPSSHFLPTSTGLTWKVRLIVALLACCAVVPAILANGPVIKATTGLDIAPLVVPLTVLWGLACAAPRDISQQLTPHSHPHMLLSHPTPPTLSDHIQAHFQPIARLPIPSLPRPLQHSPPRPSATPHPIPSATLHPVPIPSTAMRFPSTSHPESSLWPSEVSGHPLALALRQP